MSETGKGPILVDFFGEGFTHECEDLEDLRKKYLIARRIRGSRLERCIISLDGGDTGILYEHKEG